MGKSSTRRYRWTEHGEEPIWASRKKLKQMGREWAYAAFRGGYNLLRIGNTIHDEAAEREYARLKAETSPPGTPAGEG